MTPEEIKHIELCAIEYLRNAKSAYDAQDYEKALRFLDAARDEIELLAECK